VAVWAVPLTEVTGAQQRQLPTLAPNRPVKAI
jgi:hypothetical protein